MTDTQTAPGAEFKAAVLARWNLSDPEQLLLDQAAGTLDLIAEVEASDLDLDVRARELRGQRLAFARLVSQLALPDEDGKPVASITHQRAKKAARARWDAEAAAGDA
jgi:hypothetical protein